MKKMCVSTFGLKTNIKNNKDIIELNFNLPLGTEILSVSTSKEPHETVHTVWFTKLTPRDDMIKDDDYPWNTYHFFLIPCQYVDFEFDDHKYLGNILDNTFAVFYKPDQGKIIN